MKGITLLLIRKVSFLTSFLLLASTAYGAIFTATSSGNFSSSATWMGGIAPPTTISLDQIIIPVGVNVILDQDLNLNGALAAITVNGSLSTDANATLTIDQGTVAGDGQINVGTAELNAGTTFTFTGTLTADVIHTATDILTTADFIANETLHLAAGILTAASGGSISIGANSTIVMDGGMISVGGGGTIGLSMDYNVMYIDESSVAGIELSGPGLQDVIINVAEGNSVLLTSDLTVAGTLSLMSGSLWLGANDLNIQGDVESSLMASVYSTSSSNIEIHSDITGVLNFAAGTAVNNLTVDAGADGDANISGDLSIHGLLILMSGTLDFDNTDLAINGDIMGGGSLSANSSSNLAIHAAGGLSSDLVFDADGQLLNNLTVSTSAGHSVSLGSDLTVEGILNLEGASSFDINGNELTLGVLSSLSGTGSLSVDAASDLVINTSTGIPSLVLVGAIGDLSINTDVNSSVNLESNVVVEGVLNLQEGILDLNGNDLAIHGGVTASMQSFISSAGASDITLIADNEISGTLNFITGSSVNNFTVNIGAVSEVGITGDLAVNGELQLMNGVFGFDDATLIINGIISGAGSLSGNASSNLLINTAGGFASELHFAEGGQVVHDLILSTGEGAVALGSDLTVEGTLGLNGESSLELSGHELTLGSESQIAGSGSILADAASDLVINSTGGISTLAVDGVLGDFTVNSTAGGSVTLGSNITIAGILNLTEGVLVLNNYDLIITGNIAASGHGSISSNAASDIMIASATSVVGALNFTAGSNVIGTLTIDIGSNGSVSLGTDAVVSGTITFINGYLNIGDNELSLDGSASITGAGPNAYIITSAGGTVQASLTAGGEGVAFPVGTLTDYLPAIVTLNAVSASGNVQVGVVSDVLSEGTVGIDLSETEELVDATWNIYSDITAGLDMNLEVMWPAELEVNGFDNTDAFISHYINGEWDVSAGASAEAEGNGMFSIERTGITSLSPFAVFDTNTATAVNETGEEKINVYPNPAIDEIFIQNLTSSTFPVTIDIYDTNGQKVKQWILSGPEATLSVKELMHGNYILHFFNDQFNTTQQIIKLQQ